MAQYPSVVVTNKGHDLISTANATNKAVRYIKAVVGDGQLNNKSVESLTAMISPKLELPLSTGVDLGDGKWRVSFALSNSTLTNGFYAREVGVFAKLDGQDDSTAILFGYTNGGNYVDYIPPKTTPIDSQVFNCDFVIGDAENVTVNILDGTFVTHQALTNAIDIHNTATDSHQPILNAIKAISGMSAYDIAPSKTIATMIPLLGFGGVVAQRLESDGYMEFANGVKIQWGRGQNSARYPIAFTKYSTAIPVHIGTNGNVNTVISYDSDLTKIVVNFGGAQNDGSFRYIAVGY